MCSKLYPQLSVTEIPPDLLSELRATPLPQGWCTDEKARLLAGLVLGSSPACVVEIGVFGGSSLVPLALALRKQGRGVVYGIDPWRREAALEGANDPANDAWWAAVDLEGAHRGAVEALWSRGLQTHAVLIRSGSETAAALFPAIDLLHLDGNHSELASTRDVTLYLPRVRPDGLIVADDVNWPTTAQALRLLADHCSVVGDLVTHDVAGTCTGHCRVFRKL